MSLTIGEVVAPLGKAEYSSDVQLSWYPHDERNRAQTERYIWTKQAPSGYEASLALLKKVRDGFIDKTQPNRFVIRATYGHGKTHLALALANFFGQAQGSAEVENVLAKIEGASAGDGQAMRRFKELHAPFLVLRLRGDVMDALPQQVIAGLEEALHEQEATRDANLGLWFDQARGILSGLDGSARERLEAFLSERGGGIGSAEALDAKLEKRDSAVWELTHTAIRAATNVPPDFGKAIEPGIAIEQVCREFCGEGKPFAGVLIIFDEFSLFVKDYARNVFGRTGAPLQSLLDGVTNSHNKAVFVALAQQDPDLVMNLERRHGAMHQDLDNITKELTRLPDRFRFNLFSSMETVLDAYLEQHKECWAQLMESDGFFEAVIDASDEVERLFPERYGEQLGWGAEKIQTVLAEGCFPLHPLLTAVLCSLKLRAAGSTRTVMGFVAKMLDDSREQPAQLAGGVPNWVPATALADYFGEMIAETEDDWAQFRQAWRTAGGEHATAAQRGVLHAMLLHDAVNLPVGRGEGDFERNIAALCGLPRGEVKTALRELEAMGAILYQAGRGVYTFFALGQDGGKVERWLREQVARLQADPDRFHVALEEIAQQEWWPPVEVRVETGHPTDWAAPVHLVSRELYELEYLRALLSVHSMKRDGSLLDAPRGFVVCPLVSSEEDARFFAENAAQVLDEALSIYQEAPPPVVVELPAWPQPNLLPALLRHYVMQNAEGEDRRELGEAFTATQSRIEAEAETEIQAWQTGQFIVPLAYRAALQAREVAGQSRQLSHVLDDLYEQAYRWSVPGFFRNYKANSTKLNSAVMMACAHLAGGTMASWPQITKGGAFGTHRELHSQFLGGGTKEHWGIVNVDGRLREPQNERVAKAWQMLESAAPPGVESAPIREALLALLQPPYGYDYSTLALLFCAWFGANRHHITLESDTGREKVIEEYLSEKAPKKFLDRLTYEINARITRRLAPDANAVDRIIREARSDAERDEKNARHAKAQLELYIGDDNADPERVQKAKAALTQLEGDLNLAEAYRQWFKESWEAVAAVKSFGTAINLWKRCQEPPALGSVRPTEFGSAEGEEDEEYSGDEKETSLDLSALREAAREQVWRFTEAACASREKLSNLEGYAKQKSELLQVKKHLDEIGQSEFNGRVDAALDALETARAAIADREADKDFVAFLRSLKGLRSLPLTDLRSHIATIDAYTPRVAETRELMASTHADLETALHEALAFLPALSARLETVAAPGEANRLRSDIMRRLDRFEGVEEHGALEAALKQLDTLDRYFDKLKELNRDKPKDADELRKLTRSIEKLAENSALSETQRALAGETKAEIERRFEAAVAASGEELGKFEARNAEGEDPIILKNEIERALDRDLAFLPEAEKPRLRALHRTVQRRIDSDQVKKVEDEFLKIKDKAKRRECLTALQACLDTK